MSMQSKLYIIQLFSPPNDQFAASPPEQWPQNPKTAGFAKFPEKLEFPYKRGFELVETRRADSCPWPTSVPKISVMSMVWNISAGQLGWLAGCASSQLLLTRSLAEDEKLEKALAL